MWRRKDLGNTRECSRKGLEWEGEQCACTPAKSRAGQRALPGYPYLSKLECLRAAGAVSGVCISAMVSSELCVLAFQHAPSDIFEQPTATTAGCIKVMVTPYYGWAHSIFRYSVGLVSLVYFLFLPSRHSFLSLLQ